MVVPFVDDIEPGCFGGETCSAMEVADCWLSAREIIHIVDGFIRCWPIITSRFNVMKYTGADGKSVCSVERLCSCGSVE